jgi:hypothetical protein
MTLIDKESLEEIDTIANIAIPISSHVRPLINDAISDAIQSSNGQEQQAIGFIIQRHPHMIDMLLDTVHSSYPQHEEHLRKLMVLI